jgi:FKBP-type peptidyl-prolyl cis-trans isomerase (trigger factor)
VTIIHPPIFDVAILKSLKSDTLNDEEELSFRMFELVAVEELIENSEMSITEKANLSQAKRQRKLMRYDLNAMKAVPLPANLVERLFTRMTHSGTLQQ